MNICTYGKNLVLHMNKHPVLNGSDYVAPTELHKMVRSMVYRHIAPTEQILMVEG